LEIKELKSFCIVAKLGSFSKASQMLAMGQSAVTKQVKRLEVELGEELVERGSRPIRLTLAGANLFRIALPLVEGVEDLTHRAAPSATEPPVTVAVPHGFIGHVLLEAVREMRQLAPSRSIRIRSGTKDETFYLVQSGAVDFAIAPDPGPSARFKFTPLFPSERILITPADHVFVQRPPASLKEIARHPLVLLRFQTETRTLLETEFRRLGVPYEIAVELDSMDLLERYVELGLGLAIGMRGALTTERNLRVGIVSLARFLPSETVGVVQSRSVALAPGADELVRVLEKYGLAHCRSVPNSTTASSRPMRRAPRGA
jgi:LysR family transcriptional regulator, putative pyruvate carboxylase regulator